MQRHKTPFFLLKKKKRSLSIKSKIFVLEQIGVKIFFCVDKMVNLIELLLLSKEEETFFEFSSLSIEESFDVFCLENFLSPCISFALDLKNILNLVLKELIFVRWIVFLNLQILLNSVIFNLNKLRWMMEKLLREELQNYFGVFFRLSFLFYKEVKVLLKRTLKQCAGYVFSKNLKKNLKNLKSYLKKLRTLNLKGSKKILNFKVNKINMKFNINTEDNTWGKYIHILNETSKVDYGFILRAHSKYLDQKIKNWVQIFDLDLNE